MGGPHVTRGGRPRRRRAAGRAWLQLRPVRGRLRRRPRRPSHVEDPRHRDLGRRAQPRHLPHPRRHGHQGDPQSQRGPAVLVLRQRGGGLRRHRAGLVQLRRRARVRRRLVHLGRVRLHRRADPLLLVAVEELVLRGHRHRRVSQGRLSTSTRAAGPPIPWSTSCRTGTGPRGPPSPSTSTTTATASSCS